MKNTLTWLHLSDLHLTYKNTDSDWTVKSINQNIVIRSLLESIDKLLIQKGQKPDMIFITGDVVQSGQIEEYEVAKEFCNQLLKITGLTKQQLFIVPGNHDVNRAEIKPLHIKNWYGFDNQDDISEILSDSDIYSIMARKLEGFYKFSNNYLELNCNPEQHYIIANQIELPEIPIKINLLGLNSALFSGYDGDDKQKLAFGSYQIEHALQIISENPAPLTISFFHHPFHCFHECEKFIQNQLKEKVDLILTGHLHDPSNMNHKDSAGNIAIIGAGASYETRESENSFNAGVLDLATGQGKIQFYKYLKNYNRWTKNTDINLDEEDEGRFPFYIPSLKENPYFVEKKTVEYEQVFEQLPVSEATTEIDLFAMEEIEEINIPASVVTEKTPATYQKIAVLTANPINRNYEYDELIKGFKKLKCEVHYFCLSCETLNNLEDCYDYIFILSKLIKDKIVIENHDLSSRSISLKELEDNIGNNPKGIFIFLDQPIVQSQSIDLRLPTVIFPILSKNEIQSFIFQAFKKSEVNKDWLIVNQDALTLCELKQDFKEVYIKTALPDAIDPKTTQHFVGRVTDLEMICKRILDLHDDRNGFLTIKGAGGIGKTHIIRKIAVELAARNFFADGIDFIECEFLIDYKLFEFSVLRTFNLEQAINPRKYIKEHNLVKNALLILDNFETLLHLPETFEIKEFLNFICDYVTVVVTSRELLDLDCEDFYELRRFTTDEAVELFLHEIDRKIDNGEQKFLRDEIVETLLDNNPLAIKLITKNLPRGKNFRALKDELEEDIFQKLSSVDLEVFDSYSDMNIERKKSLYASISFSYYYLHDSEKIIFELLSLFPDGINIENLKLIIDVNREKMRANNKEKLHNLYITDAIITSLDKKSMIENNNGTIRLQSIIGRFAEQTLKQRENMQFFYKNVFYYNQDLIDYLISIHNKNKHIALMVFNKHKNNFLKSIEYIDLFDYKKSDLLVYLEDISWFFIEICTNKSFIKELLNKKDYFSDNEKETLYFYLIMYNSRYYDGEFQVAFDWLLNNITKSKIENFDFSKKIEINIARLSSGLYSMEGYSYFACTITRKANILGGYYNDFFYIGEYNTAFNKLFDIDFFSLEVENNCNVLNIKRLDDYINTLYKKDHIEIMQCHYLKAKMGNIDKEVIKKLVIVNSYTQGLQQLIFAFCERTPEKAIALYEEALINLKHIKYYYVEALYFYANFLKNAKLPHYEEIYQQGFDLAKKYYFRFLIYKFEDLQESQIIPYDPKNYPLPDDDNFDDYINFLMKNLKHQKNNSSAIKLSKDNSS